MTFRFLLDTTEAASMKLNDTSVFSGIFHMQQARVASLVWSSGVSQPAHPLPSRLFRSSRLWCSTCMISLTT